MKCKTAFLIINPRLGKNVAKLADLIAVFAAAGWKTDTALKEFGGHTMELAKDAAEAGYDLVMGYGGDGTLNQVVNGVMAAKGSRSIVGVLPGGTANVWAHEIGMPEDPVKASLTLINSQVRKSILDTSKWTTSPEEKRDVVRREHVLLRRAWDGCKIWTGVQTSKGDTAVLAARSRR